MKKYLLFFVALGFLASCEKDPDLDVVQGQVITYTQTDKSANFSTASTFYIPDSLLVINNRPTSTYATSSDSLKIINAIITNMENRGYTQVDNRADADLGIQASYIVNTYYFTGYYNNWWNGYPGYWSPGYWGYWNDWYYPYTTVFSYSNGSVLTEIVDLRSTTSTTSNKLTVIWNAYSSGLTSGSAQIDIARAIEGVNQAFAQSTYIKSTVQ